MITCFISVFILPLISTTFGFIHRHYMSKKTTFKPYIRKNVVVNSVLIDQDCPVTLNSLGKYWKNISDHLVLSTQIMVLYPISLFQALSTINGKGIFLINKIKLSAKKYDIFCKKQNNNCLPAEICSFFRLIFINKGTISILLRLRARHLT